ncbi:S-(hydroxymethyl)glutathione dehydrogenase/alcohol dehydrogenase [Kibdelosporangium banguiense]|uniref:S-(Hydroxymethyl)glutathione dehydrogenase/alcohol dehydrogenase n=1 Tax=Kibdelosporangium banguiense TaxID=1365924 RepID=A0ABS4TIK2_9PSEU|nr:zinc-binding dehydrogenase [Kibdelosporangium banguiense]MBP2324256.1 S-(hydroxymethyl)glutathione dehydrogenase/alcohol dehydrogenase [Kibdelosporangium banguiense]
MKAAVLNAVGDDKLELRDDVTTIDPGPDQVRIRVRATGICHSDLSAMDGTLPALAPGIVGHEGAGEIVEVGSAVTDLAPGDHVVVTFVPPCGNCNACLRGQPHLCGVHPIKAFMEPRFKAGDQPLFGFAGLGTFAEELVVPSVGAIKIDNDVPFEVGALVACGVLTGVGAVINTAKVEPGATVVVIGCGGVGIATIQGARLAGASTIVAVDPIAEKHDVAKRFGATHATTPEGLQELNAQLTGSEGFDYAFDVVGIPATIRSAYDIARRGGTVVVVGAGRGDAMVQFSAQELFLHEKRILGSFYGSANVRRDYPRLLSLWKAGRLDIEGMISRRIKLAEINDGLQAMRGGGNMIRQVVTFG